MSEYQCNVIQEISNENEEMIPINSKEGTLKLIMKSFNDKDVRALFTELHNNTALHPLIFSHKDVITSYYNPEDNTAIDSEEDAFGASLNKIMESMRIPILYQINMKGENQIEAFQLINMISQAENELKFKSPSKNIETAINKWAMQFNESNSDLYAQIENDTTLTDVEKTTEIMSNIYSFLFKSIKDSNINKSIRGFLNENITDILPDLFQYYINSLKPGFANFNLEDYNLLVQNTGLSSDEYGKCVETLLMRTQSIRPMITLHWCESNIHPENPYSYFIYGHSRIPQYKCSICNKQLAEATIFSFKSSISTLIRQRDGILFYFIIWLLEEYGYSWCSNLHVDTNHGDSEKDIIFS